MNDLIELAIRETPTIVAYLRVLFTKANADAPVPTDAELIAAYQAALASSLAQDEAWLAAHTDAG